MPEPSLVSDGRDGRGLLESGLSPPGAGGVERRGLPEPLCSGLGVPGGGGSDGLVPDGGGGATDRWVATRGGRGFPVPTGQERGGCVRVRTWREVLLLAIEFLSCFGSKSWSPDSTIYKAIGG